MTAPCDGCAFTEGAEANLEVWNNLKGQLCVLGGLPFVCHHDRDWRNTKQMRIAEAYADGWMICAGWKREVRALAALGYYRENRQVVKFVAMHGLEQLETLCNKNIDAEDKAEAQEALKRVFQMLCRERRRLKNEQRRPGDSEHR